MQQAARDFGVDGTNTLLTVLFFDPDVAATRFAFGFSQTM
jgi:hypothetical protein